MNNLDFVMPMYNLIQCSNNYLKTSEGFNNIIEIIPMIF